MSFTIESHDMTQNGVVSWDFDSFTDVCSVLENSFHIELNGPIIIKLLNGGIFMGDGLSIEIKEF